MRTSVPSVNTWSLPPQKGCDHEPQTNLAQAQPKGPIIIVDVVQYGNSLILEAIAEDSCLYRAVLWDYVNESPSWRKLSAIAFEYEKLHNAGKDTGLFWMRKDEWIKKSPIIPIY